MSNRRLNPKRDANEPEIVTALQYAGALVHRINAENICDLLVLFRRDTYLLEVKMPKTGRVSDGQSDFMERWNERGGKAFVVHTIEEALQVIGAMD